MDCIIENCVFQCLLFLLFFLSSSSLLLAGAAASLMLLLLLAVHFSLDSLSVSARILFFFFLKRRLQRKGSGNFRNLPSLGRIQESLNF